MNRKGRKARQGSFHKVFAFFAFFAVSHITTEIKLTAKVAKHAKVLAAKHTHRSLLLAQVSPCVCWNTPIDS
jgi:hypothetical protein